MTRKIPTGFESWKSDICKTTDIYIDENSIDIYANSKVLSFFKLFSIYVGWRAEIFSSDFNVLSNIQIDLKRLVIHTYLTFFVDHNDVQQLRRKPPTNTQCQHPGCKQEGEQSRTSGTSTTRKKWTWGRTKHFKSANNLEVSIAFLGFH